MKRTEEIDFIENNKAYVTITYSFKEKERSQALRLAADDLDNYKYKSFYTYVGNIEITYLRAATSEEIQNEKNKQQLVVENELNILKYRAKRIGYKLIKNE